MGRKNEAASEYSWLIPKIQQRSGLTYHMKEWDSWGPVVKINPRKLATSLGFSHDNKANRVLGFWYFTIHVSLCPFLPFLSAFPFSTIPTLCLTGDNQLFTHHLSTSLFSLSLFPHLSRGHSEAPQWAGEEQLHGAEFPWPQPSAQHPCQPELRGAGQEERGADRPAAWALVRQPGGRVVGGSRRLRCGPYSLPCHAGLPKEPLELPEPRPQIPSGTTTRWRAHQVAARPPGQEATAQEIHCWFYLF